MEVQPALLLVFRGTAVLGVSDNRKPHRVVALCAPERWCFGLTADGPDEEELERLKGQ